MEQKATKEKTVAVPKKRNPTATEEFQLDVYETNMLELLSALGIAPPTHIDTATLTVSMDNQSLAPDNKIKLLVHYKKA
jgi:hypothetical protein